jgi:hypothetical protein
MQTEPAEVLTFQSLARPGAGKAPARVSARPFLPQQARHCPVLEAASAMGYLVYAPLSPDEACQITHNADGGFELVLLRHTSHDPKTSRVAFTLTLHPPAHGLGPFSQEFVMGEGEQPISEEEVIAIRNGLINVGNCGVPSGAIALRGATDFRTPRGWDSVFSCVLNHIPPPVIPSLAVRVETDWYAHDTEFRYVMQPGDTIFITPDMPIGQVFFVPRAEPTMRQATAEETFEFRQNAQRFAEHKRQQRATTSFGLQNTPAYAVARASRR